MEDSILLSVKQHLGVNVEDKSFDFELIMHTNTVLVILNQLVSVQKKGSPLLMNLKSGLISFQKEKTY